MKEIEKILKAVANKRRLAIIKYIKSKKEASVGDIAAAIKLSFKSTSRHLTLLTNADVLEREQRGLNSFYSLASKQKPYISALISEL